MAAGLRGPTPHFSWRELGSPPPNARQAAGRLARHLERLRHLRGGRPLVIVSAYRSPARNRSVGGAVRSRHLVGDAADLGVGVCTIAQAEAAGFVGIGSTGPWAIHVDVRPGPPARWTYD
jgi:uncharacterized protein YcbK (DUF882 family)